MNIYFNKCKTRRAFFSILMFSISISLNAQNLIVRSFEPWTNSNENIENKIDKRGQICSIIRVVTNEANLSFNSEAFKIVETEKTPSGYNLYVSSDTKYMTIGHPKCEPLRDYRLKYSLENGKQYTMNIEVVGLVEDIDTKIIDYTGKLIEKDGMVSSIGSDGELEKINISEMQMLLCSELPFKIPFVFNYEVLLEYLKSHMDWNWVISKKNQIISVNADEGVFPYCYNGERLTVYYGAIFATSGRKAYTDKGLLYEIKLSKEKYELKQAKEFAKKFYKNCKLEKSQFLYATALGKKMGLISNAFGKFEDKSVTLELRDEQEYYSLTIGLKPYHK